MAQTLRLDIFSDPVCPWCYIGWHRLKRAVELVPELEVEAHWLPFELNPEMPAEGMDRADYLTRKFGANRLAELQHRLAAAAAADGLPIALDDIRRQPSTLAAHRLLRLAAEHGPRPATALKERIMEDHFVKGRDIGSGEVLLQAAVDQGLPAAEVRELLAGDRHEAEVRAIEAEAHRLGVSGVPFFILGQRFAVSGAQPPEILADALREAAAAPALPA